MKKILPIFFAFASFGLMANAATEIDVSKLTMSRVLSTGDYIIKGSNPQSQYDLTFYNECSIVLDGCNFGKENDPAIIIADDANVTLTASADSTLGYHQAFDVANDGTLTINSGAGSITLKGKTHCFGNNGTMTINGAKIIPAATDESEPPYFYYNFGSLTLDGVTLNYDLDGYMYDAYGDGHQVYKNSSVYVGPGSSWSDEGDYPQGYEGTAPGGFAIIPGACPTAGSSYSYSIKKDGSEVATYVGPGHGSTDEATQALYIILPAGNYTMKVGDKTYGGEVKSNQDVTFEVVPEPCFGLLCLLGLCFLRRK